MNTETITRTWQRFFLALLSVVWLAACGSFTATPTPEPLHPDPVECEHAVEVFVWGDLNGDGLKTPNEPPLEGVALMIAKRETPTDDNLQLETQQNGRAHFPTRELESCQTTGYDLLFLQEVARYQFPTQPVVNLDNFDPLNDAVHYGLLPESDN